MATFESRFGSVDASRYGEEIIINAVDFQTYDWANRPNARWPLSVLEDMPEIHVQFCVDGLIDIQPYADDDGGEISNDELTAYCYDVVNEAVLDGTEIAGHSKEFWLNVISPRR
jgi:hypothetical protein